MMMKKIRSFLLLCFTPLLLPAQTLIVRYQFKDPKARKRYDFIAKIDPGKAEAIYKSLSAIQTFELVNSRGRSRFTYVPDTSAKKRKTREDPWMRSLQTRFAYVEVYKDFIKGSYQEVKDLGIQKVCVKDALQTPTWKVTQREKHIGQYRVIKAYEVNPAQPRDTTIAWFAPDLPTFDGPFTAWGLPGLILEYQSAQAHAIAQAVRFERENTVIQPVSGMRTITQEQYNRLMRRRRLR